jgi:hypothetical protein
MIDFRANIITPGAALVLGVSPVATAVNDGNPVPGNPMKPGSRLVAWGMLAPTADSIAHLRLASLDMVDQQNGEDISPGAASLWTGFFKWTNIPYKAGARLIYAGTNVGVVAGSAFLIDFLDMGAKDIGGNIKGSFLPNQVIPPSITFAGAIGVNTWTSNPFAPTLPLPNGKYAILGAWATAYANVMAMRFAHVDFEGLEPGFPCVNLELAAAATLDLVNKDLMWLHQGYQFVHMSEKIGGDCIPVFTASNNSTGLTIKAVAAQTCTPVVTLNLAKVG